MNTTTNWSGDAALDAHWAAEQTYDYFRNTFGRNSYNGTGATISIYTHVGSDDNAYWDPINHLVALFDGTHANPYTALDVVSHEIAHGYAQSTIDTDTSLPEPAAINEGLSDIWGACVEFFAAPAKQTWLLGEDILRSGSGFTCVRNLASPNTGFDPFYSPNGYPDTYQGARYDTRDSGFDPHINSTIISHCFFLIAVGANATNSAGTSYNVTGIGIASAARILFRAESGRYFTSRSGFTEVRSAMIRSSTELFGSCSVETSAVTNAWYAVGVGAATPPAYISGPNQVCVGTTATYTTANGAGIIWRAEPAGLFTNASGSGSQFSTSAVSGAQGTGTITLTYCGGSSDVKSVKVGPGEPTGYYNLNSSGGTLQTVQFVSPGDVTLFLNEPFTFTFSASPSSVYLNNTVGRSTSFRLNANQSVQINVTSSQPDCGLAGRFVFSTSGGYGYRLAPNPASDELTVTATDPANPTADSPASPSEPFDADLYDTYGRKVKTKKSDHGKAVLDVRSLPEGLYNLRVGTGKDAYSEHIQVTH